MTAAASAALAAPLRMPVEPRRPITIGAPAGAGADPRPTARPTVSRTSVRPYPERRPLGDPTPLVCTVSRLALEVALGGDGIEQLTRWVAPDVRACLLTQRSLARRAQYTPRGSTHVQRVRLCRVSPHAVEVSVVATEGELAHALAMRLEEVSGRWLVTVLDVG